MTDLEKIIQRSRSAKLLDERIAENTSAQEIDLTEWIFDKINIQAGSQILELCCGTGIQTVAHIEKAGSRGFTVAVDISEDAIDLAHGKLKHLNPQNYKLLHGSIDDICDLLSVNNMEHVRFDVIFCAYGLYYSKNALDVLYNAKRLLKINGRIVIVGPYGENNRPLFEILKLAEVSIPEFVMYTSSSFMDEKVIPWGKTQFRDVSVHKVVNHIKWTSPEKIIRYWENSTFYDGTKRKKVSSLLKMKFVNQSEFTNEKWIMLVEMAHGRS